MFVMFQDLPVKPSENLVAQTLIAEVTSNSEDRFSYFIGKEEP